MNSSSSVVERVVGIRPEQKTALEAPFRFNEHGFVEGKVYLRKSAIRHRLWQIDPSYDVGEPKIIFQTESVIAVTLPIIVKGVVRYGVGTGVINRLDSKKQPLSDFMMAREIAKAIKTAASDALPRAAVEFGIGGYLKDAPRNIPEADFAKWLQSRQPDKPTPQPQNAPPPPAAPEPAPEQPTVETWATPDEVRALIAYSIHKLEIIPDDIKRYWGIDNLTDAAAVGAKFPTKTAAGEAIKAGYEEDMAKLAATPPATPKNEAPAQPAPVKSEPAQNGQESDTGYSKYGKRQNWTPEQIREMEDRAACIYDTSTNAPMTADMALSLLGKIGWSEFPTVTKAIEALRSLVLKDLHPTIITFVVYKKQKTTLGNTLVNMVFYGVRDAIRQHCSLEWAKWCETWKEGKAYQFADTATDTDPALPDLVVYLKTGETKGGEPRYDIARITELERARKPTKPVINELEDVPF